MQFYELPREREAMLRIAKDEGIEELVEELLSLSLPDERYALSNGCLTTMYLADGDVLFALPQPYTEDGSVEDALTELEELVRHADLPLRYVGVVPSEFPFLLSRYRHTNVDLIDKTDGTYRVCVLTEPMLFSEIPEISGERLTLSLIDASDGEVLEHLDKDAETARYFRVERSGEVEGTALERALSEYESGISIPLAIRQNGETLGDLTLYAFDGKGGAEVALRILPEKRRQGFAKEALECAFCFAEGILSLSHLDGVVKVENAPSLALCSKLMTEIQNDGERVTFRRVFNA
ncbi:MAG: GNAT family N-acetyltransferase [Clostridia bacterium]|nr:GNAT family N-acetyltransferase [Clostridia bacterium]